MGDWCNDPNPAIAGFETMPTLNYVFNLERPERPVPRGVFCKVKEIKGLCTGILKYAAQTNLKIDT